jgi:hypothetical protein
LICAALLQESEKARLQWALERDLAEFDRDLSGGLGGILSVAHLGDNR